ncbi:MAG TPA: hypothetical protein VIH61_08225, partial [Waddliaceae bacterium]
MTSIVRIVDNVTIIENFRGINENFSPVKFDHIAEQNIIFGLGPALSTLTNFFSTKEIKENLPSEYLIMAASIASAALPLFTTMKTDMKVGMVNLAQILLHVQPDLLDETTGSIYNRLSIAFATLRIPKSSDSVANLLPSIQSNLQPIIPKSEISNHSQTPKKKISPPSSRPSNLLPIIQKPENSLSKSVLTHFQDFTLISIRLKNHPYDEQNQIFHLKQVDKIC